jgi:hypothetical protein
LKLALSATVPSSPARANGLHWTRALVAGATAALTLLYGTAGMAKATATTASAPVHVIVRGQAGCAASVAAGIAAVGGRVSRPLDILDGAIAIIGSDRLAALRAAPCVAAVTPDGSVTLSSIGGYDPTAAVGSLYNTERIIGAQAAWNAGATGQNVGIAVIDTGVSPVPGSARRARWSTGRTSRSRRNRRRSPSSMSSATAPTSPGSSPDVTRSPRRA